MSQCQHCQHKNFVCGGQDPPGQILILRNFILYEPFAEPPGSRKSKSCSGLEMLPGARPSKLQQCRCCLFVECDSLPRWFSSIVYRNCPKSTHLPGKIRHIMCWSCMANKSGLSTTVTYNFAVWVSKIMSGITDKAVHNTSCAKMLGNCTHAYQNEKNKSKRYY